MRPAKKPTTPIQILCRWSSLGREGGEEVLKNTQKANIPKRVAQQERTTNSTIYYPSLTPPLQEPRARV